MIQRHLEDLCIDQNLPRQNVELLQGALDFVPLLRCGLNDKRVGDLVGNDPDVALTRRSGRSRRPRLSRSNRRKR